MKTPDPYARLYVPDSFVRASPAARAAIVSGCGPGWLAFLVPETLYGLNISAACNIHDWMYFEGETIEEKQLADRVFLNNMLRLIEHDTRWGWLRWLRRRLALNYYQAVKYFGGPLYWHKKNPDANEIWSITAT